MVKRLFLVNLLLQLLYHNLFSGELHTGVYSNQASGFKVLTLIVGKNNYAMLQGSVSGVVGKYTFNQDSKELNLEYINLESGNTLNVSFLFDTEDRSYVMIKDKQSLEKQSNKNKLQHTSDDIPANLSDYMEKYPKLVEEHLKKMKARKLFDKRRAEKLAKEKPIYEEAKNEFIENPESLITKEYYSYVDRPAHRAFLDVIKDTQIKIPEEVLIALFKDLPPENHWLPAIIFTRPELTKETIVNLYPRARELGNKLNYTILVNIVKHPNTPAKIIEELATQHSGAISDAQIKIYKQARAILAKESKAQLEDFYHIYDVATKMPKSGNSDYGKRIFMLLASSQRTPTDILKKLTSVDDAFLKLSILENQNKPDFVVQEFASSTFPKVRAAVASNPELDVSVITELSEDKEGSVRANVVLNLKTPESVLIKMVSDDYYGVRRNLIKNPKTPIRVIQILAKDENVWIKSAAKKELSARRSN